MSTNKELIQRILSLYNKGVHSNNLRLRKRQIYSKLVSVRSYILTLQANKKQSLSTSNYQTLKCVVMKKAPLTECSCIPEFIRQQFSVYKSEKKIPTIIKGMNKLLVSDINTLDGIDRLDLINYAEMKYFKGRKFGLLKPFVLIHDNYLYMVNAEYQLLEVTAIFDKPLEVEQFNDCGCGTVGDCIAYQDLEFPIEEKLEEGLLAYTKQEMLNEFLSSKVDKTNNTSDEKVQDKEIE